MLENSFVCLCAAFAFLAPALLMYLLKVFLNPYGPNKIAVFLLIGVVVAMLIGTMPRFEMFLILGLFVALIVRMVRNSIRTTLLRERRRHRGWVD